jgi:hypothetical protein
VEEDGVAGGRLQARDVLERDRVARTEPELRHVHEQPARDDLRNRLRAESIGAPALGEVGHGVPVVGALADLEVVEPVEVRAELHRSVDDADHPVDLVVTDPTTVLVVGRGDERLVEVAAGKDRDALVEHVGEVV